MDFKQPEVPAELPEAVEPQEPFSLEKFMGVKLFAWLGGLALFLCVAFFVKYSFDHDLIPAEVRVIIGFLLAIGLVIGGLKIDRTRYAVTAQTLIATGVVSLYYQPNAPHDVTVLDAYATVDVGGGSTITAGKFLSYLGYEAFDIVNMSQISYANGDFLGPIPGYHSGVKWDYSDKETGFGLALLDSVYSGPNYLKGDGEQAVLYREQIGRAHI